MLEIDGVRNALERANSQCGDELSDAYWQLIDLATNPYLDNKMAMSIAKRVHRLNIDGFYLGACLEVEGADVIDAYINAMSQVATITRIPIETGV